MRNYIILNGKDSREISGLLIQSLPPISKPKIRTNTEEIDGRDGDIVTKLGYSAYDKELSIGLYGNYNVDEVIEYFNSKGTVVFSNEPDKYYNYEIIDSIDFERLIRFKTAKVKMHVQPFKYAVNEGTKVYSTNKLNAKDFKQTTNGVTLSITNGEIKVSGTATANTEFYVPISSVTLPAGNYTLKATTSGTNAELTSIRVIKDTPTNVNTFGGKAISLVSNSNASLYSELTTESTYNYLYFYITAGTMNFTLKTTLTSESDKSISVLNAGNYYSKPIITIYGTDTINLSLNGEQIFILHLSDELNQISIDTNLMEAYNPETTNLLNRYVTGDYDNFNLKVGTNTISWTGDISKIEISKYSRWI